MSTGEENQPFDDDEEEAALGPDFFVHAAASRRATASRPVARRKPAPKTPEPAAEPEPVVEPTAEPELAPAAELPVPVPVPESHAQEPVPVPVLQVPVDEGGDGEPELPVYVSPIESYVLAPPENVTRAPVTQYAGVQTAVEPVVQSGYQLDHAPAPAAVLPAPAVPGYGYPPAAAPESAPALPARVAPPLERPAQDAPARWGWRGRVRQLTGGLVSMPTGSAEAEYRADLVAVQRTFGLPRTVVFVNPVGGAGTTASTLMAARTFGVHRGGGVLAWDTNDAVGPLALGMRTEPGLHPTTSRDLVGNLGLLHDPATHPAVLDYFVRRQQEGRFDVLAAPGTDMAGPLDAQDVGQLHRVLQRFYPLVLVDTGDDMHSPAWQRAVAGADLLVVTVAVRPDSASTATSMLDALERHVFGMGMLRPRTVTVVVDVEPHTNPSLRAAMTSYFADRSTAVREIPYDPALAGGVRIDHARLSDRTHRAWLHACAAMAAAL